MEVEVHALYALSGPGDLLHDVEVSANPHRSQLPSGVLLQLGGELGVRRPVTPEYPRQTTGYATDGIELRRWSASGLPDVAEVRVEIRAEGLPAVIEALKDLYDPAVDVLVDGRMVSDWFSTGSEVRPLRGRALVVSFADGTVLADPGGADDAALAQLLCKDTALDFELARMNVETPKDLNAARLNAIHVWGEQTVVRSLDPNLRNRTWPETLVALSATVTAARAATESSVEVVRRARGDSSLTATEKLGVVVQAQAEHERAVGTRLQALMITVGRPMASYLEALVRQTRLDVSVSSLDATFRDALRNIEVEARLEERKRAIESAEAASDVRTVVSTFAIVSILLSILGVAVGVVSIPVASESRYDGPSNVAAFSLLVFLASAALAVVLVRATRSRISEHDRSRRRARWTVAAAAVLALVLLGGAVLAPSAVVSGGLLLAAGGLLVFAAVQTARLFRLADGL